MPVNKKTYRPQTLLDLVEPPINPKTGLPLATALARVNVYASNAQELRAQLCRSYLQKAPAHLDESK
jgi:hypothetical protein